MDGGAFAKLIMGREVKNSDVFGIVSMLAGNFTHALIEFECLKVAADNRRIELYGAFLARLAIESSCAALLARVDAARAMMAKLGQAHRDYDVQRRNPSSLSWSGDILPLKSSSGTVSKGLTPELEPQKLDRALLSDHIDAIFWQKGIENFLEWEANVGPSYHPQLDFVKSRQPAELIKEIRGVLGGVYSFLSKAVHPEHLSPKLRGPDSASVVQRSADALEMVGVLGLLSHFLEGSLFRLGEYEAVATLKKALPA